MGGKAGETVWKKRGKGGKEISTLSFLVCFRASLRHAFLVELDG
jgi:hypothetical protein